jgi:hypothetical protein
LTFLLASVDILLISCLSWLNLAPGYGGNGQKEYGCLGGTGHAYRCLKKRNMVEETTKDWKWIK